MEFHHISVLLPEMIESVLTDRNGIYVDCTLGGGGHSLALAEHLTEEATLIGIDQDQDAIAAASERLASVSCKHILVRDNFSHIAEILESLQMDLCLIWEYLLSSWMKENGDSPICITDCWI